MRSLAASSREAGLGVSPVMCVCSCRAAISVSGLPSLYSSICLESSGKMKEGILRVVFMGVGSGGLGIYMPEELVGIVTNTALWSVPALGMTSVLAWGGACVFVVIQGSSAVLAGWKVGAIGSERGMKVGLRVSSRGL